MSWNRPVTKGFIVNLVNHERMTFQYNPNEFIDEKGLVLATLQIPGQNHPHYQFVAGEPRRISFKLHLLKERVKERAEWLQTLISPADGSSPPKTLLVIGELYQGVICIVRRVKIVYFNSFEPKSLTPLRAAAEIEIEVAND